MQKQNFMKIVQLMNLVDNNKHYLTVPLLLLLVLNFEK